jgi:hypothetical protein
MKNRNANLHAYIASKVMRQFGEGLKSKLGRYEWMEI